MGLLRIGNLFLILLLIALASCKVKDKHYYLENIGIDKKSKALVIFNNTLDCGMCNGFVYQQLRIFNSSKDLKVTIIANDTTNLKTLYPNFQILQDEKKEFIKFGFRFFSTGYAYYYNDSLYTGFIDTKYWKPFKDSLDKRYKLNYYPPNPAF